ncbi:MAG: hypothetical protein GY941_22450 [Planctomycetes bacterium]|nr:hypothetical protein [Planctomycetota bacterium]
MNREDLLRQHQVILEQLRKYEINALELFREYENEIRVLINNGVIDCDDSLTLDMLFNRKHNDFEIDFSLEVRETK